MGVADPNEVPQVIQSAVQNIGMAVTTLADLGATSILVPNMVNLGLTPRIRSFGDAAVAGAAVATGAFNQAVGAGP